MMELWLYPLTLLIGSFIGAAGIGGVALAPAIHVFLGIPLKAAAAIAMASFVASGAVGTIVYQRRGSIEWGAVPLLGAAVAVSAFLGALTLQAVPAALLHTVLAALMVFVGLRELRGARRSGLRAEDRAMLPSSRLAAVGLVTGWGSAVTATGGPLILIPVLLLMRQPVGMAVGLGQVVQIPIGISATVGNQLAGEFDMKRAVPVAIVLTIGTAAGALAASRIPQMVVRTAVAVALIVFGLAFAVRI